MREEKEGKSIQGDFMAFLGLGNCLGNKKKKKTKSLDILGHTENFPERFVDDSIRETRCFSMVWFLFLLLMSITYIQQHSCVLMDTHTQIHKQLRVKHLH